MHITDQDIRKADQQYRRKVQRILEDCRLTRAYEEYGIELERTEALLAEQGVPNQCPYPFND